MIYLKGLFIKREKPIKFAVTINVKYIDFNILYGWYSINYSLLKFNHYVIYFYKIYFIC